LAQAPAVGSGAGAAAGAAAGALADAARDLSGRASADQPVPQTLAAKAESATQDSVAKATVAEAVRPLSTRVPAPSAAGAPARTMLARVAAQPNADEPSRPACYRTDAGVVRLDSTETPRGRAVRSVTSGEVIGAWSAVGTDSVRLVLLVAGTHTVPTSSRIACPSP
jgi:hypothetical protein